MNKIIALFIGILFVSQGFSQTDVDALRYSQWQPSGSARVMGAGGAFGALGGDFTALSVNPAGIATYRGSQFMMTPGLIFNSTNAQFADAAYSEASTKLNFNNIGAVFANVKEGKWKTVNFAIGTNRLANYNKRFYFEGVTPGSITERWTQLADGFAPNELSGFEEGLAYAEDLIFDFENDNTYGRDAGDNDEITKLQDYRSSGSMNELLFALGGNYNHRLYIGATVGLPIIRYEEVKSYEEYDDFAIVPFFNSLRYSETLSTSGFGVNAKFGLIYRMSQAIRIGAAVHSPTFMSLSDDYFTSVTGDLTYSDGSLSDKEASESQIGKFNYKLITPWRVVGSASMLIKKLGFLSAEIEYVDYGAATFDLNTADNPEDRNYQNFINNQINSKYGKSLNARVGGEIAMEIFRIRAGYGVYASPFNNGYEGVENALTTNTSFGLGIQEEGYFVDFALVSSKRKEEYLPYTIENSLNNPVVINTINNNQFVFTIGFKF